ncbi:MAG TPA: hypothetical protein VFW35_09830 [Sphingomicrobium sp.]|nr:hypothetical protein [Sphingomicrobium sp.]
MRWKTVSHLFFALTILAIAAIGLLGGSFAPILAGVPKSLPDRQVVADICNIVLIACGAGLIVRRTAAPAALALLIYLIIWTILFKVPFIIRQPLIEVSYQTCGENAVLIAAAWLLYLWSVRDAKAWRVNFLSGGAGLRIAHLLYGFALIAFGFSHFAYLNLTAPLVPAWLPGHVFWAYLTGGTYILTGGAIIIGFAAGLAAAIAALQIALITLLVWGPMIFAGHISVENWQETAVSWALSAAAWVVAISYEGHPWLKRPGFGALAGRLPARG